MTIRKIPHRCPLCSGSGKLPVYIGKGNNSKTCHGCNGRGIVMVEETITLYPRWHSSILGRSSTR